MIGQPEIAEALTRTASALRAARDELTALDQAAGDGDLGITAAKMADALDAHAAGPAAEDLGKYVGQAGLAVNRVASSTMGTLVATALMRAGMAIKGAETLTAEDLARMFEAADKGVQERGKAKLGDKTVVDAMHPAAVAFCDAVARGEDPSAAARAALEAARRGRDEVTPLQNRIGRASWVGERTRGAVDPGCALFVLVMEALAGAR